MTDGDPKIGKHDVDSFDWEVVGGKNWWTVAGRISDVGNALLDRYYGKITACLGVTVLGLFAINFSLRADFRNQAMACIDARAVEFPDSGPDVPDETSFREFVANCIRPELILEDQEDILDNKN
ncbi:hypothetical protein HOF67_03995 [Candidatus Peregrinibacteria bacterium]|nr:hypothetical protein [Candidatus Peregrinibacteria bacterium]